MKIELIRRSERTDYVCYGTNLEKHGRPNKLFKLYIPRLVMRYYSPPERFIAFCSVTDIDESKHTCRKCKRTYPKYQWQKHRKRFHK